MLRLTWRLFLAAGWAPVAVFLLYLLLAWRRVSAPGVEAGTAPGLD